MKPWCISIYRPEQVRGGVFRSFNPTSGEAREFYAYGAEHEQGGNFNTPQNPCSAYFADDEESAKLCAKMLAGKNPGLNILVSKTGEVYTAQVPKDVPIQRAKFSEKGLLPA